MVWGDVISPALDLVEVSRELCRLRDLRSRVESTSPHDEVQKRCRLAMLGLVDLALKDFGRALVSIDDLFARAG